MNKTKKLFKTPKFATREDWLNALADEFREIFFNAKVAPILPKIRISCGFPKGQRNAIGQCWSSTCSKDKTFEIFIHPGEADGMRVGDILLHECIHAAVGVECGHRGAFRKAALACGLTGAMNTTTASDRLKDTLTDIMQRIGEYPHAQLVAANGIKKQGTRLIKLTCDNEDCSMVIRTTRKWLDEVGEPQCACGGKFELEE
jgi:hypothetical protein